MVSNTWYTCSAIVSILLKIQTKVYNNFFLYKEKALPEMSNAYIIN